MVKETLKSDKGKQKQSLKQTSQGDESKPAAEANKTEKEVQPDVPKIQKNIKTKGNQI